MSISPLRADQRAQAAATPGPPSALPDSVERTRSAAAGALPPSPMAADQKKITGPSKGAPKKDLNLWIQNAKEISSQLGTGKPFRLSIGPNRVTIRLVEVVGRGRNNYAYLVETPEGDQLILKLPNRRMQNMAHNGIADILKNELLIYKNFKAILDNEINAGRVAQFHDLEPFINVGDHEITAEWAKEHLTHGFHLVEYIPHEYPVNPRVGEMPMRGDGFLEVHPSDDELSAMFRAATLAKLEDPAGKTISVDLKRDHVRMDNDGILVLIDPASSGPGAAFETLVDKFLATFAPPGSDRHRYLDPKD